MWARRVQSPLPPDGADVHMQEQFGANQSQLRRITDARRWRRGGDLRVAAVRVVFGATWVCGVLLGGYSLNLYVGAGALGMDAHAYWHAIRVAHPYAAPPGAKDAFLYSPLFLEAVRTVAWLPWPAYCAIVLAIETAAFTWLAWPLPVRWRIPVLLLCIQAILVGNIYGLLAVSLAVGARHPTAWLFLLLTKVTPAAPVVTWTIVRRDVRALVRSAAVGAALIAVSIAWEGHLWMEWFRFLAEHRGDGWVPLKVAAGTSVAVVAARLRANWLLPVATLFAIPNDFLGYHTLTILVATIRIVQPSRVRTSVTT